MKELREDRACNDQAEEVSRTITKNKQNSQYRRLSKSLRRKKNQKSKVIHSISSLVRAQKTSSADLAIASTLIRITKSIHGVRIITDNVVWATKMK